MCYKLRKDPKKRPKGDDRVRPYARVACGPCHSLKLKCVWGAYRPSTKLNGSSYDEAPPAPDEEEQRLAAIKYNSGAAASEDEDEDIQEPTDAIAGPAKLPETSPIISIQSPSPSPPSHLNISDAVPETVDADTSMSFAAFWSSHDNAGKYQEIRH